MRASACILWKFRYLIIFLTFAVIQPKAFASDCTILSPSAPMDAEVAYLRGDYEKAATLYQSKLFDNPQISSLIAGLAQTWMQQNKLKDAGDLVRKSLTTNPKSVVLLTVLGKIQYLEGTPWLASETASGAMKLDPCYPQLHLLNAKLARLNSLNKRAEQEIKIAYTLDPSDPSTHLSWIYTLPIKQRVSELESFLSSGPPISPGAERRIRLDLDDLYARLAMQPEGCHLVSKADTATLPLVTIAPTATTIAPPGFDIKVNEAKARLVLDSGSNGLWVNHTVAERAGLKPIKAGAEGGNGSKGSGYVAFADDIKIGDLEFNHCEVKVANQSSSSSLDGVIGLNVFSGYLITLDYPGRKLIISALPKGPDESSSGNSLQTDAGSNTGQSESAESAEEEKAPERGTGSSSSTDRYIAPEMADWTRVYRAGNGLLLPVILNEKAQRLFLFDTAVLRTVVSLDAARMVAKVQSSHAVHFRGLDGKDNEGYSADSINFRFGNVSQKFEDVTVVPLINDSRRLGMDIGGFVGIPTLAQMTIKIDYRDGLMKFIYDPKRGSQYSVR